MRETAVRRLYLLDGGSLSSDQGILTYRMGLGKKVRIPVVMALLDTTEGYVLFDTGLDPRGIEEPDETWGQRGRAADVRMEAGNDVRQLLREAGLAPGDVKTVVNSHLHWDHAGANGFFPSATFWVQREEWRFACYPDVHVSGPYMEKSFKHPLDYRLVDGPFEVVPGVWTIPTPGHTPGHQSLVVRLPNRGCVILAADAIFTQENVRSSIYSASCHSSADAMRSMRLLVFLAQQMEATLVAGHDPGLWDSMPRFPSCFD